MTGFPINPPNAPIARSDGWVTPEWYRFFAAVQNVVGVPTSPAEEAMLLSGGGQTLLHGLREDDLIPPPVPSGTGDEGLLNPYPRSPDLSAAWPVGAIFIGTAATNPAELLGFGTWEAYGEGRVLAGYKEGDPDFGTLEGTGGADSVASAGSVSGFTTTDFTTGDTPGYSGGGSFTGTPTSVLQPYITVMLWLRTA